MKPVTERRASGLGFETWVKRKLRREGLSYLPPSLALRKEAHEAEAHLVPLDVERIVEKWRCRG